MRIETYSNKYFLDVVRLVENFHKEAVTEWAGEFDVDALIHTIKAEEENWPTAFLLIVDDVCQGILFGKGFNSTSGKARIFQEVIWYVNEPFRGLGVRMLREVEKLLKSKGFDTIIMAVLENSKTEKLKRLYSALGYKPMEVHYVRNI